MLRCVAALAWLAAAAAATCPARLTGTAATALGPPWPTLDYASIDELTEPADYRHLLELSATEVVGELCSGSLSAVTYATALLKRIRETECLNAWAALSPQLVLEEAAAVDERRRLLGLSAVAPLCGLPVGLKDVLDARGYATVAGTPALEGHLPPASLESALVVRLRRAGGVVLGKLRLHELGGGDTTLSPVYGPTLNPHNVTHIVGGSSGGNGAALAAHAAVVALCADSGGSCRSPASLTGTVGFRPSTGCFNAGPGVVGMGAQRDTVGVSARTVADVQLLNSILSDCGAGEAIPATPLKGLRVGKPNWWWNDVGVESLPALHAALAAMEAAGAVVVELDAEPLMRLYETTLPDSLFYAAEMPSALALYLASHNYSTSLQELVASIGTTSTREWVGGFMQPGGAPSSPEYYSALTDGVPALRAAWAALFDSAGGVDVLALPTTPLPARPISDVEPKLELNGRRVAFYEVMGRAFQADCVAGIPGISLNAGVSLPNGAFPGGMPVGLMLQARRKEDGRLLSIAAAVEAVLPPPPAAAHAPACAGCTARLGWIKVAYPAESVESAAPPSGASMAYAEDSYVLDFEGECAVKESGVAFPMLGPHAVGTEVDWSSRAGVWRPGGAGCAAEAEEAAVGGREAKTEL